MDGLTLGSAIRVLRERRGLSARALSLAAGLSPAYVSKVEAGHIEPSVRAFGCIARVLNMNAMEITACVYAEAMLSHPESKVSTYEVEHQPD